MPLRMALHVRGAERYRNALRDLQPRKNPTATRRAMRDSIGLIRKTIPTYLRGPRPRRLDRVTHELAGSLEVDFSGLPWVAEIGVPARLWWAELHELGLGRFDRRPFVEPALEEALEKIPEFFRKRWEEVAAAAASRADR